MFYCCDTMPGLHFFNGGDIVSRGGFIHQRRTMECWVLIYVLSGRLDICTDGREYSAVAAEWLLLRPGAEHYGTRQSAGELSYLWGHFSAAPELSCRENAPDGELILPEHGRANSQRISLLFRQLVNYSRRKTYTPRMTECALQLLLMEITQEYRDSVAKGASLPPLVEDVNEWIRLNCHRQLNVKMIAEEFHYNPEYLSALYSKAAGITLTASVNRARLDIAKRLLSDRSVTIKEAAYSCGFSDEKYFMRVFRRAEGMTPEQYRAALGVK